jgi:hypothetical protein
VTQAVTWRVGGLRPTSRWATAARILGCSALFAGSGTSLVPARLATASLFSTSVLPRPAPRWSGTAGRHANFAERRSAKRCFRFAPFLSLPIVRRPKAVDHNIGKGAAREVRVDGVSLTRTPDADSILTINGIRLTSSPGDQRKLRGQGKSYTRRSANGPNTPMDVELRPLRPSKVRVHRRLQGFDGPALSGGIRSLSRGTLLLQDDPVGITREQVWPQSTLERSQNRETHDHPPPDIGMGESLEKGSLARPSSVQTYLPGSGFRARGEGSGRTEENMTKAGLQVTASRSYVKHGLGLRALRAAKEHMSRWAGICVGVGGVAARGCYGIAIGLAPFAAFDIPFSTQQSYFGRAPRKPLSVGGADNVGVRGLASLSRQCGSAFVFRTASSTGSFGFRHLPECPNVDHGWA